jgi:hypothetical protein
MSDDHSPGDRRQPYSDIGGPEARHAQTHDVRREWATNPRGPEAEDTSFEQQLAPAEAGQIGGHAMESAPASEDKLLHERLPSLSDDELARLAVLEAGARLEQGGVYLDLNRLGAGPFKAIGGHIAGEHERLIAKRDTDFALWNRLAGSDRGPDVERPDERSRT